MSFLECKKYIKNVSNCSSLTCETMKKKRKEYIESKVKKSSFLSIDTVENYIIGLCINELMDADELTIDKELISKLMSESMENKDITEDEKNELIRLVTGLCFSLSEFRKRIVFKFRDLGYNSYLSSNEKKIRLTL